MGRDLGPGRAAVLERDRFEDPVDDPDRADVEAGQDLSQCFGVVLAILEQALDLLSDVARGLPVFGEVSDRIPGFVRHAQDEARTFPAAGHGAGILLAVSLSAASAIPAATAAISAATAAAARLRDRNHRAVVVLEADIDAHAFPEPDGKVGPAQARRHFLAEALRALSFLTLFRFGGARGVRARRE